VKFYLGTHRPNWLRQENYPLFVSHRTLGKYKKLPEALHSWALDSGGFSELSMYGEWRTTPDEYITAVRRYRDEVGNLDWAAPQDWMCEPQMLERTGLDVAEHQRRTVDNYLALRHEADDLPFVPVLQGWEPDDYLRHVDLYAAAGVDLPGLGTVGLGTVCRRNNVTEIADLVWELADAGLSLHGFGVKITGLRNFGGALASADSMAWSYAGRMRPPLPGCTTHKNCANCVLWARQWRGRVLDAVA
jgi:hypothetical protein